MKWAVLGASGFIGTRFVERLHLGGTTPVRPIVRGFSSLARLSRFELDWRVASVADVPAMTAALEGCDVLLHAVVGDEAVILGSIPPVYEAAQRAGIRRIVYLSSSSVHGLAPEPTTTEESPLSDQQFFTYNNSKVRAERLLARVREKGPVEVTSLRPSVVFGPRSRWCAEVAKDILSGTAYLLNEGRGICNTIYIDNLLRAIELAAVASGADGQTFLVRDGETVTWRDFYEPLLKACGASAEQVHRVTEGPALKRSVFKDALVKVRMSPLLARVKPLAPRMALRMGKAMLGAISAPEESVAPGSGRKAAPCVTAEMAALQQCAWRMPCAKAETILGYKPEVTFTEGMRRSIGWLKFAGYPVQLPA